MSIAKYTVLGAVRMQRALRPVWENGIMVFTFTFLSAQASKPRECFEK
jgi:hypothetical protein